MAGGLYVAYDTRKRAYDEVDGTGPAHLPKPRLIGRHAASTLCAVTRIRLVSPVGWVVNGEPTDHIAAYMVMELATRAWIRFLTDGTAGIFDSENTAAVTTTTNFRSELLAGDIDVDLALRKIGNTSITLSFELGKDGMVCASGSVVLAKVGAGRRHSVPINAAERTALEKLHTP